MFRQACSAKKNLLCDMTFMDVFSQDNWTCAISRIMESKPHQVRAMFYTHNGNFPPNFFLVQSCGQNGLVTHKNKLLEENFLHHALRNLYKSISVSSPNSLHNSKNLVRSTVDYYWLAIMNIINTQRLLWKSRFEPVTDYPAKQLLFSLLTASWPWWAGKYVEIPININTTISAGYTPSWRHNMNLDTEGEARGVQIYIYTEVYNRFKLCVNDARSPGLCNSWERPPSYRGFD